MYWEMETSHDRTDESHLIYIFVSETEMYTVLTLV